MALGTGRAGHLTDYFCPCFQTVQSEAASPRGLAAWGGVGLGFHSPPEQGQMDTQPDLEALWTEVWADLRGPLCDLPSWG